MLNLEEETKDLDFDKVREKTLANWEKHLSAIKITSDDEEIEKNFYTALYHTMIMPTNFTDLNGEYLGFDKKAHTADGFGMETYGEREARRESLEKTSTVAQMR